jgi:hypothetical protein
MKNLAKVCSLVLMSIMSEAVAAHEMRKSYDFQPCGANMEKMECEDRSKCIIKEKVKTFFQLYS